MKFTIYTILILSFYYVNVSNGMNADKNNEENGGDLGQFFAVIFKDPKFLVLSDEEQYKLLSALYTIVFNNMKTRYMDNLHEKRRIKNLLISLHKD